ncbi:TerC family protein [Hazenella sp. IB182357]|uniref:TerC family protein n=1 Tax=Polycladospora coralii TaxID=2771432 RepID=A0A926N7Y1_9BACL|nr:TerC family protein [Polycladospora coralii]MBD1371213.1 TerC family protein [Polycladospora coralii]MBS7530155.1 TerC family protein [Polycladospora coralii]
MAFDSVFWIGFVKIIILDLILSGDNAVVIGMAARHLPEEQRKKAILFGAGVAVLLRASLTAIAAYLLKIPFLMTAGGLLLLWIAVKLLLEEKEDDTGVSVGMGMKNAIKTIVVADVVMSLDNVVAVAGAAQGDIVLVLFGLALSIPLIMWGSKLIANILNRLPWLIYVGAAILGYTAGELIVKDPLTSQYLFHSQSIFTHFIPFILAGLVLLIGQILKSRAASKRLVDH